MVEKRYGLPNFERLHEQFAAFAAETRWRRLERRGNWNGSPQR
jgi:hypothetical protein